MAKYVDSPIGSGFNVRTEINAELAEIEENFQRVLYRDGSSPNHMLADLDMNSKNILNTNNINTQSLSINGQQVVANDTFITPLPDPASQGGKYIRSDGTSASWQHPSSELAIKTNTVATMKALTGLADGAIIQTLGYAAGNDNGNGTYRYDVGSAATADNGKVHTPNTLPGRFRLLDQEVTSGHYGAKTDGTTDATATILAALNTGLKTLTILPNTLYDRKNIITNMPAGAVVFDMSQINDFRAAGETTKRIGILSKDADVNDTHWTIDSGHHSIINLNNYGTAGSTSASERKASILWSAGKFDLAAADKQGFRGAAIEQFTQDTGNSYWKWTIRSLAPWNAISSQYELWATGQSISGAGIYRYTGDNHYVSTGAGTTGATMPVHTSGTASDGGVSWTYVDSADRSIISLDQYNRLLLGVSTVNDTFTQKVTSTDPLGGTYSFNGKATGASKPAILKLTPTSAGSAEDPGPFLKAVDGKILGIQKSDNTSSIIEWHDTSGTYVGKLRTRYATAVDLDATPSVSANITTLYLSNTGATSVTALDDGLDGQRITLVALNANTTLVHSATLMLTGSVNLAMTTYTSVTFEKVPNAISNRWIEVSRSVK